MSFGKPRSNRTRHSSIATLSPTPTCAWARVRQHQASLRLEAHDFLAGVAIAQPELAGERERHGEQREARPGRAPHRRDVVEL